MLLRTLLFALAWLIFVPNANSEGSCAILGSLRDYLNSVGYLHHIPGMQVTLQAVARYATTDATVLITGETGTGKEMVAELLHRANPSRQNHPFVVVDSTTLIGETVVSQLFGYETGSFTGANRRQIGLVESANRGTLFIDEIEAMSLETQAALLRFLNNPATNRSITRMGAHRPTPVNVRVVVATNVDLQELVKAGKFRRDLYYRLNMGRIELKTLRERRGDIIPLANHFLKSFATNYGKDFQTFSPDAVRLLNAYTWPGNVRELSALIERSVLEADESQTEMLASHLRFESKPPSNSNSPLTSQPDLFGYFGGRKTLEYIKAVAYVAAFRSAGGNQTRAAQILDISARTFGENWRSYQNDFPELFREFREYLVEEMAEAAAP